MINKSDLDAVPPFERKITFLLKKRRKKSGFFKIMRRYKS
jgi:hypothetical protein